MVLPKSHQAPLHHKNKRSLIQRLLDRTTSVFVGFKSQLKLLLCGVFQRLWTLDSSNLILFLTEITGYQRFAVLRVLRQRNVREKILREWPVSRLGLSMSVARIFFFLSEDTRSTWFCEVVVKRRDAMEASAALNRCLRHSLRISQWTVQNLICKLARKDDFTL